MIAFETDSRNNHCSDLNLLNVDSLEFYHNLLQRDELNEIFLKYSVTHSGLAMTTSELKRFLQIEQAIRWRWYQLCKF